MFEKSDNPGYERLARDATGFVVEWLQNDWYETSAESKPMLKEKPQSEGDDGPSHAEL